MHSNGLISNLISWPMTYHWASGWAHKSSRRARFPRLRGPLGSRVGGFGAWHWLGHPHPSRVVNRRSVQVHLEVDEQHGDPATSRCQLDPFRRLRSRTADCSAGNRSPYLIPFDRFLDLPGDCTTWHKSLFPDSHSRPLLLILTLTRITDNTNLKR